MEELSLEMRYRTEGNLTVIYSNRAIILILVSGIAQRNGPIDVSDFLPTSPCVQAVGVVCPSGALCEATELEVLCTKRNFT